MRIPLFGIIAFLTVGKVTADEDTPDVSTDNSLDLLSTLKELNQTLAIQIADLQKMETTEERTHLIQHYSAQKKNIESEIALIQSIQASSHTDPTSPRHILKKLSGEAKTVPSFLNIFKKPKNPNNEQSSNNVGYSLPYPFYYPGYGEDYTYPYYGPSVNPEFQYPNDLVHETFPGHRPGPNNEQTYPTNDLIHDTFPGHPPKPVEQSSHNSYDPPTEIITLPGLRSSTPRPQVQPPMSEPHHQFEQPYRPQADPSRPLPGAGAQNQIPLGQHHGPHNQPPNSEPHHQFEQPYRPQPDPSRPLPGVGAQNQIPLGQHHGPQNQPPNSEPHHQFEQPYRPQPDPSRPLPGVGAQNQIPLGQHHGVFVYYPNGVTNDEGDEDERITIASRFGQAIDRVGQVISNLANRQIVRSPEYGEDGTVAQFSEQLPSRYRVRSNRPRSLPGGSKLTLIEEQNRDV